MKLSEVDEGGRVEVSPDQTPPPSGKPTAKLSESGQPSMLESMWQGLLHGGGNVVTGARQLGARIPGMAAVTGETPQAADAAAMQRQRDYKGPFAPGPGERMTPARANPTAAGVGEFVGEAAATAPLALIPGGAGLAGRVGMGALQGAVGGALNPVVSGRDFWQEKGLQAGGGLATGGVMGGAGGVMAPALGADAQAMARRGVGLTSGQRLGLQGAERKLQAFPILSGFVEGKVGRAADDFNRAAVRQALEPIGLVMPRSVKAGHDMIAFMKDGVSHAYDRVLPMLTPVDRSAVDAAIKANPELQKLIGEMASDDARRFQTMINNRILDRFDPATGAMEGPLFKKVDRDLGKHAVSMARSSKEISDGTVLANQILRDEVKKAQTNPELVKYLDNIDHAWAMSVRLDKAAAHRADSGGRFTPSDLLIAIRDSDASNNHAAFARGDALMQDFAEQANRVMGGSLGAYPSPSAGSMIAGAPFGAAAILPYAGMGAAQRYPAIGQGVRGSAGPMGAGAGDFLSSPPPRDDEDRKRPPRHSTGGP